MLLCCSFRQRYEKLYTQLDEQNMWIGIAYSSCCNYRTHWHSHTLLSGCVIYNIRNNAMFRNYRQQHLRPISVHREYWKGGKKVIREKLISSRKPSTEIRNTFQCDQWGGEGEKVLSGGSDDIAFFDKWNDTDETFTVHLNSSLFNETSARFKHSTSV